MTYIPCTDVSVADWIASASVPWRRLVTLGPPDYPAYGRLRFIPDPAFEGQSEHEALPSDDHPLDEDQLRFAVETLLPWTGTPDIGYMLFWAGSAGGFPAHVLDTPQVKVPEREYYLCRVSLPGFVAESWDRDTDDSMPPPAFIWPEDRAWCITQDVDPHWGGIGASVAAIGRLLLDPRLDVVPAEWDEEFPWFS